MGMINHHYADALKKLWVSVFPLRRFCGRAFTFARVAKIFFVFMALSAIPSGADAEEDATLFPEAHDPVLGGRAAIVEWAWSPQYAKRFDHPTHVFVSGKLAKRRARGYRSIKNLINIACLIVGNLNFSLPI